MFFNGSLGFGSNPYNSRSRQRQDPRPVKTRFRSASAYRLKLAAQINSLTHYTRGTRSPPKGAPTACRHPVSGPLSLPSSGCFSPFPHGTSSLSVACEYLALRSGLRRFTPAFPDPALLGCSSGVQCVSCTGLLPSVVQLS